MAVLRTLVIALALFSSGIAVGALERLEDVLELEFRDVRLPAYEVDSLIVRKCEHCDALMLKASPATEYRVNGMSAELLTLADFRAVVHKIPNKSEAAMVVGYAPDTMQVTRVIVFTE